MLRFFREKINQKKNTRRTRKQLTRYQQLADDQAKTASAPLANNSNQATDNVPPADMPVLTSEEMDRELASLPQLVKNANLDEIKTILTRASSLFLWMPNFSDHVKCAMRDAILLGQLETVRLFLDHDVFVDAKTCMPNESDEAFSYLYLAAASGNLPMVRLLVERGATVQPESDRSNHYRDHYTGLMAAVNAGHADIVDYLLEMGAKPNEFSAYVEMSWRITCLVRAAVDGNIRIVDSLVKYGANIENALELVHDSLPRKHFADPALYKKINDGYPSIVKTLLDYAIGVDCGWLELRGSSLQFLEHLDISGFNFTGMSIHGVPITRDMLMKRGFKGAEHALVTVSDIEQLDDHKRRDELLARLAERKKKMGELIDNNGSINLVPLWRAAQIGDVEAVKTRLEAGHDPNNNNTKERIPIELAAAEGRDEMVKLLAHHPRIDRNSLTAAMQAAKRGSHQEIANYLLELINVDSRDKNGNTGLHTAIQKRDLVAFNTCIFNGANVNLQNTQGETPLHLAASIGSEPVALTFVNLLLKAGANGDLLNKKNETPLRLAAAREGEISTAIVASLLEKKANANLPESSHNSVLRTAVIAGNIQSVELLLPHVDKTALTQRYKGKDVSVPWYTDLMMEQDLSLEMLSVLKAAGADFNAKSVWDDTLLMKQTRCLPDYKYILMDISSMQWSITNPDEIERLIPQLLKHHQELLARCYQRIQFLLENGADPRAVDSNGNNPIHNLVKQIDLGHLPGACKQVLELFLRHGADINAKDGDGNTALHLAVMKGDWALAVQLMELNANGSLVNDADVTASQLLATKNVAEMISKRKEYLDLVAPMAVANIDSEKESAAVETLVQAPNFKM